MYVLIISFGKGIKKRNQTIIKRSHHFSKKGQDEKVSVSRLQNSNLSKLLFFTFLAFKTIVRDFSFAYNLNLNFFKKLNSTHLVEILHLTKAKVKSPTR